MRLPKQVANPALAALIEGGGFRSLEQFAQTVNVRGWELCGLKLAYDHVTVKRWLSGSVCQNPDVVATVLSEAWGVPVPVQVIWPELRDGAGPAPAHLVPWVSARTLEALAAFVGSDMLTRREVLAGSVAAVSGNALVEPVSRWLGMRPVGLREPSEGTQRIGMTDVAGIEEATTYFSAVDAEVGGGLSREAAVGQLKYAVDLLRYASYSDAVGNRLLAAVAELADIVGWMCHDSGMKGPAQRYLLYGLQAARESTDPRAALLVVGALTDLGRHLRWAGDHPGSLRLFNLALDQLPSDRTRYRSVRAILWSNNAWEFASTDAACLPEARNALALAADLQDQAEPDDRIVAADFIHVIPSPDAFDAEIASLASCTYLAAAQHERRLATQAEESTQRAVYGSGDGAGRNNLLRQVRLARARFLADEPDQACDDGDQALDLAERSRSSMVTRRLHELYADSEPYRERPRVREFRGRLREIVGVQRS